MAPVKKMSPMNAQKEEHGAKPFVRIAIVAPGIGTEGGITTVVSRITEEFAGDEDIEVIWIASHRSGTMAVKVIQALSAFLQCCFYFPVVDVVHIHSSAYRSFFRKSIYLWLARLLRCSIIWHFHAPDKDFNDFLSHGKFLRAYVDTVLGCCKTIVVLSKSWLKIAEELIPNGNFKVIYNPIPADWLKKSAEPSMVGKTQTVFYLGHLIPRKGYDDLIHAFAKCHDQFKDWKLVFAGSGELEQAQFLAEKCGIAKNVEFLGWIQEPQIIEQFDKASIFVLPSYQEGLPMSMLEAMAVGIPVITTPVGGVPDVIISGTNGILVDPGDIDAITDALVMLMESPEICSTIGREGRHSVRKLVPKVIAEQWKSLYFDTVNTMPMKQAS
ncbi:MAG: hypothetical protein CMO98_11140 [Woeseia sp.]|nr:hypothetical protein [Woeseia sp.]|tara:strand:- start:96 stop:1247 length:1152 start_codon:yes stop_codon:yes gene_type:complete